MGHDRDKLRCHEIFLDNGLSMRMQSYRSKVYLCCLVNKKKGCQGMSVAKGDGRREELSECNLLPETISQLVNKGNGGDCLSKFIRFGLR